MNKAAVAALALFCVPLLAERYAVLAGISQYRVRSFALEGPANDIAVLETTLTESYGYDRARITTLVNESATKDGILKALRQRVKELKAGDHLLFYFSGHGTSAYDKLLRPLATYIGPDSGALAPWDLDVSSAEAAAQSLLIGRRDLRPVLSAIPASAQALVILDACYSENAARALGSLASAPSRGISLSSLVRSRGTDIETVTVPEEQYPYPNIVAMSAASRHQPALDLNRAVIRRGHQTFDGKPHGAFSNSFLSGIRGCADTNHDGLLTYDELYRFIRRDMERFPQTPQMLAAEAFRRESPALGAMGVGNSSMPVDVEDELVGVRLEAITGEFANQITALHGVRIVENGYSLLLRQTETARELFDRSGTLIRSYPPDDSVSILKRIQAEAALSRLATWRRDSSAFNIRLDVEPASAQGYDRYRATYRTGERLRVRIGAERTAWLLLLNIDKTGHVSVLFPGADAAEQQQQAANVVITVPGLRVRPPAGSEHLRLFAFTSRPEKWDQWTCSRSTENDALECPEFGPEDKRMYDLLNMIRTAKGSLAETSLRVVTHE